MGIEPMTLGLLDPRSDQLSYAGPCRQRCYQSFKWVETVYHVDRGAIKVSNASIEVLSKVEMRVRPKALH